jgi:hypothetical protein
MPVTTSLGTTISVVLGAPATYDAAGFGDLNYQEVGEVSDIAEYGGESEIVTHTPLKTGIVNKLVGTTDYGTASVQFAKVFAETGQDAMKAGFDGANRGKVHSFEVTYFDGGKEYFTAIITSFKSNIGSASSVRMGSCNVALNNAVIAVDPV